MKRYSIFGVGITDTTIPAAIELLAHRIEHFPGTTTAIFFANTHTLNLAIQDPNYRAVLNGAGYLFGDGTGVRWALRAVNKVRLMDNVNGTDLIPMLFRATADRGYKCFLLGATHEEIKTAAEYVNKHFAKWTVAGYRDGYFSRDEEPAIIRSINDSGAHLLLVGMGNPLQEQFIYRNVEKLRIPVAAGTGGLFTYWAGNLERAPVWMRRLGAEWVHILLSQPHKWRRYLLGNIRFLCSVLKEIVNKTFHGNRR